MERCGYVGFDQEAGLTALCAASRNGYDAVVRVLLESGADVNQSTTVRDVSVAIVVSSGRVVFKSVLVVGCAGSSH